MKKLTVVLIGAGDRGSKYTNLMVDMPDQFQVVGVAEPIENRRENIKHIHNIYEENCFNDWNKLLNKPKFADIAIISTQDSMHYEPAMKALELGYDLLLEKPIAPTEEECVSILRQARKYGRKIIVCHVLRYTSFYGKLKELLENDKIGDIMSITHTEGVGNVHQSHSFVRGNWGNTERSTFMLLAKTCHDIDLLQWIMNKKCKQVQSFGSLNYFTKRYAPEGAADYCIHGCPHGDTCYYNAVKLYLEDKENMWFRTTITGKVSPTDEHVIDALNNSQYGRCVYKCDNDVVDHQVVNMEFEGGPTVSFTMSAFNQGGRKTNIMGIKGEIFCDFERDEIKLYSFDTRETEEIHTKDIFADSTIVGDHGGGDTGIVHALYDYITGSKSAEEVSEIGISCENHLLVFAAEKSRLRNSVVKIDSEY